MVPNHWLGHYTCKLTSGQCSDCRAPIYLESLAVWSVLKASDDLPRFRHSSCPTNCSCAGSGTASLCSSSECRKRIPKAKDPWYWKREVIKDNSPVTGLAVVQACVLPISRSGQSVLAHSCSSACPRCISKYASWVWRHGTNCVFKA